MEKEYQTTKEDCEKKISGVCCGCGGKLEAIETVDNAGSPTFWVGCNHCHCFRGGVDRRYFEIARELVEQGELIPYTHMDRSEYEGSEEKKEYWLDSQTAGLSYTIARIHKMFLDSEVRPD
jgi:hypothetical protein